MGRALKGDRQYHPIKVDLPTLFSIEELTNFDEKLKDETEFELALSFLQDPIPGKCQDREWKKVATKCIDMLLDRSLQDQLNWNGQGSSGRTGFSKFETVLKLVQTVVLSQHPQTSGELIRQKIMGKFKNAKVKDKRQGLANHKKSDATKPADDNVETD